MGRNRSGSRSGNRGASQLGCIVRLALVVAAAWIGFQVAEPFWNYVRLKDEMDRTAHFAANLTDDEVRRRVIAKVRELDLPQEAEDVRIQRRPNRDILIWLEYTITLPIPGFERQHTFRPEVRAPI